MINKQLGKIQSASFGLGGYQECMIGLWLTLGGESWGIQTGDGAWGIERSDHTKWTEESRLQEAGKAAMKLASLLWKLKKTDVSDLVGAPVEVTLDGNRLVEWRLLSEVL